MAYARIDPFGEEREDQRSGVIVATLANIHRDEKKRREPFTWEDFLRPDQVQQEEQTVDQIFQTVMMFQQLFGGREDEE